MNNWIRKISKPILLTGISITIALSGGTIPFMQPPVAEAATVASKANQILASGHQLLGKPYRFGTPAGSTSVFDCSSFVQYVFKKHGKSLPRTSQAQATQGTYVAKSQLKKGDLVFFSTPSSKGKIGHVAIYAGNGKILHTYKKGVGVTYSNLNSDWWKSRYITARRVL